jgi:hypothetical protein
MSAALYRRHDMRYIFSINTGRAGSQYLSDLLGMAKNVVSFHEPQPQMIDRYLNLATKAIILIRIRNV